MMNRHSINWKNVFFISLFFWIIALSAYMQFTSSMNIDASNGLHESTVLFSGGKYFYDFYETTPPFFFYLYFPIVEAIKYFPSVNFFIFYFLWYLLLSLFSITLCHFFLKKILQNRTQINLLTLLLAALFLLEPPFYFGQREFVALILTLPYFLLFALRLEEKNIHAGFCVATAILAGVGFGIEPHFCLAFFLSEIYFLVIKKSFYKLLRIENVFVYIIFIVYLISTFLIYPGFFYLIIPLTLKFYYVGIKEPFYTLFIQHNFIYAVFTLIFYLTQRKKHPHWALMDALLIGMIGFILSYFAQLVPWKYHMFTAYGFAIFLNGFLLMAFAAQQNISIIKKLLTTLVLIILIFIFPILTTVSFYQSAKEVKKIQAPIVYFLKKFAYQKPVYFFESVLNDEYPTVDYAGSIHCSRFPYLIWMPAYLRELAKNPASQKTHSLKKINQYFVTLMSKDIEAKKPLFILVDSSVVKNTPVFGVSNLNYLTLFLQTPEFKKAWKAYRYFGTINAEPYYKLTVYKLKTADNAVDRK